MVRYILCRLSSSSAADITQKIGSYSARTHLLLRLKHEVKPKKGEKVCSGQHRFTNQFSGSSAGKPHVFTFIGSISLVNACETAQRTAGV